MRRPLPPASWILLILAFLALAYNVLLIGLALLWPTDGCSLYLDQAGLTIPSDSPSCPLQAHDIITAIDGRPISQDLVRPGAWQRFLFERTAAGATYTIDRHGQVLEVWVPWQSHTLPQVIGEIGLLSFIGSIFVLNAILLLLSRTRDPAAPIMALFFLVEGFNLINNAWEATGTPLTLSTFWFAIPLDLLSFGVTFAAALHAFLLFPERKAPLHRFPALPVLLYALNLVGVALGTVAIWSGPPLAGRALTYRFFYPLAGAELLIGVGMLAHTYFTTRRPGVRNQIRWLFWGVMLGPLPWLLLYNLPVALGAAPLLPLATTALALIVIPVAFFFSVTRRGLSTVDTVINRTLVYTILVALLVGLYLGAAAAVDVLTRLIVGQSDARLSAIVAVILVALFASPLRGALHRLVQRLFYRRWVGMQQLLREVGERLSTTLQLETIVPVLTQEIPNRLRLTRAALLLRQEDGSFADASASGGFFPGDHPLVAQAEAGDAPLVVGQSRYQNGLRQELARAGWEVALPLRSGGRLVGLYFLGPRQSGDLYTAQEVESLRALGRQVASTLENTRLYSQVERYTQQLEDLVAERTRDLARANLELASERDRLDVILKSMADGLLVTHPGGRILLVNPALESLLHRPAGLLVGMPVGTALPLSSLPQLLARALQHPGQLQTADMPLDERMLRASAAALLDGSAVITVLRDITHEREVDRMKTEFVSTVSHELRAPLTSVLGFTKLINRTMERDVVPLIPADHPRGQRAMQRIRENLEIIVAEGERLTRLINDVLDISKMEAGRVDWHDQPFDLLAVIRQAADNVHTLAAVKGLPIRLRLPEELPTLQADPDRILQVVTNLLSNAIKFTDHGEITLRARLLAAGERANGWSVPEGWTGGVLVCVQDTGVGIPPEAIGSLFQRFQQVEATLRDRPKGTGLGLAICREIVTHYGGSIWAESEVGCGSCFSFTLPLAPAAAAAGPAPAAPPAPAAAPPGRAATLLIVDDEENVRRLLRQELTEAGYGVLEAADGTAAITAARQQQPDLLILDVKMPGLSGADVSQVLRADAALAHIPIVVLSVEDQQHRHDLEADAYLTKPVQIELLLQTIAQLLARAAGPAAPGGSP